MSLSRSCHAPLGVSEGTGIVPIGRLVSKDVFGWSKNLGCCMHVTPEE